MTLQEIAPIAAAKDVVTRLASEVTNGESLSSNFKPGMRPDVKNLYQSKPDNRGKTTWVEKYPDDLEEAAENAETARYALLIRNSKCYDGRKKLQIDSIVVQSPLLKNVLGTVLKNYPGITTTLDRLTFKAPFQPFVHRWKSLLDTLEAEKDSETKEHLELFHRTIEVELRDDLKARDDFIQNGVITFDTVWMIFEPGTIVYTFKSGQHCAAKFNNGNYGSNQCGRFYSLNCQIVDWDGENFGLGAENCTIWEWEGTKRITKLSAYPLEYQPNLQNVKDDLTARGRAFEELSGYHYKYYQGIAIGQGPWGPIKYNVSNADVLHRYFQAARVISAYS